MNTFPPQATRPLPFRPRPAQTDGPRGAPAGGAGWRQPLLRPIRAEDAEAFQRFVTRGLGAASRRMRFHGAVNGCSPALLKALTQLDPARHRAWVAVQRLGGENAIVGEARIVAGDGVPGFELALAVADDQRGCGLADRLLETLVDEARRAGIPLLFADVLEDNARMFGLLQRHGFELQRNARTETGSVRWRLSLAAASCGH